MPTPAPRTHVPRSERRRAWACHPGGPVMERVLLVIGDAAEVLDTLYPLHRICEDGYQVLVVASVCHGIEILATAGVLKGKTVTTVAKCRFDAEVCGATYVNQEVVVSGNIVTARTWHDNHAFMREYMRMLNASRRR